MKTYQKDNLGTDSLVYMPVTDGESYEIGEALSVSEGCVTKCTGTQVPDYICAQKAIANSVEEIAVVRISKEKSYIAQLSTAGSNLKIGDKVTIAEDGIKLTATTGGAAEIVSIVGTAAGDDIIVRF